MEPVTLLEGAYDLHVHTGPDVSERKLDDLEMAERLENIGMKGFVIKSHYFSSAERARVVRKVHPNIEAFGALTLNYSVGGLNPHAVEMAAKMGVKNIWMPTFNAKNEIDYMMNSTSYTELPPWAKVQSDVLSSDGNHGLTIFDGDQVKQVVDDIIDLCKQYDLILCTGHLSKDEIFALVTRARDLEHDKVVVTHPTFSSVALSKEEQKGLTELGAIMEMCFGVITPDYGIDWPELYETMQYVGAKNCILSSDLGQVNNPYPDEGLVTFVSNLLANGFTAEDIRYMTVENTSKLVED